MFLLKRTIAFLLVLSISFGQSSLIDNLSPKQIKSKKIILMRQSLLKIIT